MLEGAVKVREIVVELVTVAVPTVGTPGAPFAPEPCDPRIGMCISYTIINSVYSTYTSKNRHLDGPYTFNLII